MPAGTMGCRTNFSASSLATTAFMLRDTGRRMHASSRRNAEDAKKLRLRPGDRLVEVGSGWGYMAIHAAEHYGAQVVNYGLVPEQNWVKIGRASCRERV